MIKVLKCKGKFAFLPKQSQDVLMVAYADRLARNTRDLLNNLRAVK